jgi:hypothetical protein
MKKETLSFSDTWVHIKLYDILNFYPEDGSSKFLWNIIYKTTRYLSPEDWDKQFFWNGDNYLPDYTVSYSWNLKV